MKCPGGGSCFDLDCQTQGCQGFDVQIEAVTVIRTSIRSRRGAPEARTAEASLVLATPARRLKAPA